MPHSGIRYNIFILLRVFFSVPGMIFADSVLDQLLHYLTMKYVDEEVFFLGKKPITINLPLVKHTV